MEQDLYTTLPQEIAIDIFSRLPFWTIMKCKCVCKSWWHLLSTREFVDYHHSKSLPGLILSEGAQPTSSRYKIGYEGAGETSSRYKIGYAPDSGRDICKTVCDFGVPQIVKLHSSANGLLLFVNYKNYNLFVCNPLTREYINLPPLIPTEFPTLVHQQYGFGVSKVSGEYKVVRISINPTYKFEVYTLGTGLWRSVAVGGGDDDALPHDPGVFVDGKLYSLLKESCININCFDLETEVLSTVSCPSSHGYWLPDMPHLCALGGRLCLCLNDFEELVIWVMRQAGHWTKEFVICDARTNNGYRCDTFSAIKVLGEGKILLVREGVGDLYYYSRKRKMKGKREILKPIGVTRDRRYIYRVGYTPSFLPLKSFALENVCYF